EGYWPKPRLVRAGDAAIAAEHASLGRFRLAAEGGPGLLFTENETNVARLFGAPNGPPYVKDAFHEYVVHGRTDAVSADGPGTKPGTHHLLTLPAGAAATAAREPPQRAQRRLAASLQPRRAVAARRVGISLVRRLGPRVPHGPLRARRSHLRQGAARALHARVVHAPERAAAGLRVRVL